MYRNRMRERDRQTDRQTDIQTEAETQIASSVSSREGERERNKGASVRATDTDNKQTAGQTRPTDGRIETARHAGRQTEKEK